MEWASGERNGGERLVNLFLLVDAELPGTHVYKEEEAASVFEGRGRVSLEDILLGEGREDKDDKKDVHNRQDLEKVVFGKILVWVMFMKLDITHVSGVLPLA